MTPLIARFQYVAHMGPTGSRWAPSWPHELCYLGHICNTRSRWAKPYSNQEYPCMIIHIITAYTHGWLRFLESFLCDHARLHHRNVYIRKNLDLTRAIDDWRELRAWYICTSIYICISARRPPAGTGRPTPAVSLWYALKPFDDTMMCTLIHYCDKHLRKRLLRINYSYLINHSYDRWNNFRRKIPVYCIMINDSVDSKNLKSMASSKVDVYFMTPP